MQIDDFAASIPSTSIIIIITILLLNSRMALKPDNAVLKILAPVFNRITDFNIFYKIILLMLPLIGIIGVTVPLIVGLANFSILGIYLALPLIVAPVMFKFLFNKDIGDISTE